ncbi:DUF6722 family protein [Proteiniphilum sp. X52]|uniref:DUF6722 family protein n=1 Tax=Proteiniphilum sp. X52 TaxID=2382159 RepID=UPI000F0A5DD2|nr:DUF6722 family protein [Proteiniphilum sp. X52]RNC66360.1 hypothetical protein D7D25_02425 [Proteiniphilum sp. X52]
MKKEFGKWLMDIAKYMTTAILLSTVFSEIQNIWVYLSVILAVVITLVLGLLLVQDKKKGEK